ncbi:EamA family transporter [Paenibacillus sediminis]|uniref:Transporter family protein n=2 Tax=Paenibacillus sediminis TaxID=664909 RepID=A0ABS4H3W7_9BACL|nr:transporter family protein [Paenibacillus sediminis]
MWLIYALLSAAAAAMVGIFGKMGLKDVDANTATAVRSVIMTLFLFAVVAFQGNLHKIPSIFEDKKAFFYISLTGVAGATSWIFYFLALKYGKVSQVAPVDKLSVVIAAIAAVIILGEKISLLGGIGIGLIAIGAILVALG